MNISKTVLKYVGMIIMNLKTIIILMILINLGTASAVDLQRHDFEGKFQMDVPYKSSFEKDTFFGLDIGPARVYHDFKNDLNVSYVSVSDDDKYFNDMIETIEKEPNVNMTKDNSIYLISTEKFNIALFHENHKIIAISAGNLDFDAIKEMANSCNVCPD